MILLKFQRFIGQNRPQFRASNTEDPSQVKDLVEKLEKYQNPDEDSEDFYQCNIEGLMGLSSQMIITLEKTDHQHFSIKSVLNV